MRFIARRIFIRQRELVALLEHDLTVFELAKTHLRSLRVQDQGNDLTCLLGCFTNHFDAAKMLCMITMGEVEACAVHAIGNQRIDNARSLRGRSLRADNFVFFNMCESPPIPLFYLYLDGC